LVDIIQKDKIVYYICYIVGIIEKDKYGLLQYEDVKYLLHIPVFLIKINLTKLSWKANVRNL